MLTELPGISLAFFNGFTDQLRKLVWISLGFGHPGVLVAINARPADFSR